MNDLYVPELDKNKFAHHKRERQQEPNMLNATKRVELETELRQINRYLGSPETINENSGLFSPKNRNADALIERKRRIEKMLERNVKYDLSREEKLRLYTRMTQLERIILEYRPLTMAELQVSPKDYEAVKRLGQMEFEKTQVLQKYQFELKNIRKQLWPEDPKSGDINYLRRR